MNPPAAPRLLVSRSDLGRCRFAADPDAADLRPLGDGEVRLKVDAFALTSNNVTYAAFGDSMQYWNFFPTRDPAEGCVPVWGFADVTQSRLPGIAPGRRVYGFLPFGSWLVVRPQRLAGHGFVDAMEHRAALPDVYNRYAFCDADTSYRPDEEAWIAALRPLFATAFLIDDFLAGDAYFGAGRILLSSASSKTAIATAFCLRRTRPGTRPRLIGLTSAAHAPYCRALGCFDDVWPYERVESLDPDEPSAYVDFAGRTALRDAIHRRLGDALRYSMVVGATHRDTERSCGVLPGPRPQFFFAPAQMAKRSAAPPAGWGGNELQRRVAESWRGFLDRAAFDQPPWFDMVERRGADAAQAAWRSLLGGSQDPREAVMLRL
jgi:hypothetical protein